MSVALTLDEILARKNAGIRELQSSRQKQGERLARWVELTPNSIQQGIEIVRRRLARGYCHARELNLEWEHILKSSTKEGIMELLKDRSEHSEQLRACAPFLPQGD